MTHTTCDKCSAPVTPVVPHDTGGYQYSDALWIGGFGGFGMFVESAEYEAQMMEESNPLSDTGATFGVLLCQSCAKQLVDDIPALTALFHGTSNAH